MYKTELIEKMRKDGYPYKIKGNGGYNATLYEIKWGQFTLIRELDKTPDMSKLESTKA